MFYQKTVFKKIRNIYMKVTGLQLYQKETPTEMFSSEYCEILMNTYFKKPLLTAAYNF